MQEKIFQLSLFASFLVHVLIMASLFFEGIHYSKKIEKIPEIVYHMDIHDPQKKVVDFEVFEGIREEKLKSSPEILKHKNLDFSPVMDNMSKQPVNQVLDKKLSMSSVSIDGKRTVSVPLLQSEKITNPKYIGYYEKVRSRIKAKAYFYLDDPDFKPGEVYLTFVVSSDGILKNVQIIDDKTKANAFLRQVGVRSIKESSPFPAFPEDLKYPELTFNVVISFELND